MADTVTILITKKKNLLIMIGRTSQGNYIIKDLHDIHSTYELDKKDVVNTLYNQTITENYRDKVIDKHPEFFI